MEEDEEYDNHEKCINNNAAAIPITEELWQKIAACTKL